MRRKRPLIEANDFMNSETVETETRSTCSLDRACCAALVLILRDIAHQERMTAGIHSNPRIIAEHDGRSANLYRLADEIDAAMEKQHNAEVSEVAVADSTKTRGVRPPLSLD